MEKCFRVLVAMDWRFRAVREIITGILDYAVKQGHWDVRLYGNDPESAFSVFNPGWHPDGIIGNLDHLDPNHTRPRITAKHNLYFSSKVVPHKTKSARWVLADNAAIGLTAAEHLLERHFPHYAFVGSLKGESWSDERFNAYAARLAQSAVKPLRYETSEKIIDWRTERESLGQWLLSLPRPCAIFAACDARARHVIETCRFLKIQIPERIAVLGVDNDEILCELSAPPLSSIELGFTAGGRLGAEILDHMMHGKVSDIPIVSHYGVHRTVARLSTTDLHGAQRTVTLACDYIRRFSDDPTLNLTTVAAAAKCSTRYLQKCFKSVCGTSALDEIHSTRLEHACRLLKKTQTPIDAITSLCGFTNNATIKRLFKKKYGRTMSAYRKS